ncbi:hypothetical protein [Agrococcus casei]
MTDTNSHNEAEHRADGTPHDGHETTEEKAAFEPHGSSNPGVTTVDDEVEELPHDQSNPAEHRAGEGEHGSANPGPHTR